MQVVWTPEAAASERVGFLQKGHLIAWSREAGEETDFEFAQAVTTGFEKQSRCWDRTGNAKDDSGWRDFALSGFWPCCPKIRGNCPRRCSRSRFRSLAGCFPTCRRSAANCRLVLKKKDWPKQQTGFRAGNFEIRGWMRIEHKRSRHWDCFPRHPVRMDHNRAWRHSRCK